jgi:hypothetical protein
MTVEQLLDSMSSQEMTEWVALYKIEASEREQQTQRAKNQAKRKR